MSHYEQYKVQVLDYCQDLTRKGYLIGTGGNVSVRIEGEDALAITPSSMDYLALIPDDICIYNFDREAIEGEHFPSVEMAMHIAVLQNRADVNAVIHTHQPYASTYALINEPIPALFDEQVANLGNCVDIVPYGMSGTVTLLENITTYLGNNCNAYILQNHGALSLGETLDDAWLNVELLEKTAETYLTALAAGREVVPLPAASVARLVEIRKAAREKAAAKNRGRLATP